jgi:dolichol-phosphate mannosyltransferase
VDLAIVIPVLNEAENIALLLQEIESALDGHNGYDIIVVDDGSSDATPAVLAQCRERHPQLQVLRHTECRGQSAALLSGVRHARREWIATLDGDGQNDPADIQRLRDAIRCASRPVSLVSGDRRQRRDGWLKRVSSRLANRVRGVVLGDGTPDTGCGLKLFRRSVFMALPHFDHMHRFLPALVQMQGGEVLSVEVGHRARRHGRSSYGVHNRLWVGLVDLLGVLWLQRRALPPADKENN